jgi:hypothetical protein
MLVLVFLLGLFLGGWLLAGTKWKRRYREEVARREVLERDYKHRAATDIHAHDRVHDRVHDRPATTTTTTIRDA